MAKIQSIRECLDTLYDYRFESLTDLVGKLKPITDALLVELDTKDKQIERLKGLITFDTEYNELKINVEELIKERDMYADAMFSAVKELDTAKQENEQLKAAFNALGDILEGVDAE